jgi:hypothetical protein
MSPDLNAGEPQPSEESGIQTLAGGRTRDLWLVFVLLRHRPGVYARVIRAPDCLAAERAAAITDHHEVLETLGAQLLGRRPAADGAEDGYRGVEVVGHRSLMVGQKRIPMIEVLTPKPDRDGRMVPEALKTAS